MLYINTKYTKQTMKTLVCIIGQIRIPNLTWDRFKKYVLDEFDADLALCIHDSGNTDRENPYHKNAKYVFECHETSPCWSKRFDEMNPGWRDLVSIPGDWIGAVKEPIERKGSGGILIFLRWFLYQNLMKTGETWDRIILTRSDYFWTAPHPALDNDHIWIPNAEFHGGLCDRHSVIPAKYLKDALTLGHMENHIVTGNNMVQLLNHRLREGWGGFMYNVECFIYLRFLEMDMLKNVGFFPMNMFLIDETSVHIHPEFKVRLRYPSELEASREIVTWPFHIEHNYLNRGSFVGRVIKV